jgi:putative transposase
MASRQWPRPAEHPVWQLDFWDTQLRREESYAAKWDYEWRNPVRKGLVARPEDWPYAGEMHPLVWHEP